MGFAVGDSGAYMTVMDLQSAMALGLHIHHASNRNCGSYTLLGGRVGRDYLGAVDRSFELHLGSQVKLTLAGMRVIEHLFPLFLIGKDMLCRGKKGNSWNYTALKLITKLCGKVVGMVGFAHGDDGKGNPLEKEDCPQAQAAIPRTVQEGGGLGSMVSMFVARTFCPSKI